MNQTHFSARELADLQAPGLPGSVRRIKMKATDAGWPSRRRPGKGGELEYPIDALPLEAQAHIREQLKASQAVVLTGAPVITTRAAAPVPVEPIDLEAIAREAAAERVKREEEERRQLIERRAAARVKMATKPEKSLTKAYARSEILGACEAWIKAKREEDIKAGLKPVTMTEGEHLFCHEYNSGRVEVHPATRERIPRVHKASIERWRKKREQEGQAGLMDKHQGRKGSGKIDSDERLQGIIVRQAANNLHVRVPLILDEMRSQVKRGGHLEHLWTAGMTREEIDRVLPSETSIHRWLRKFMERDGNLLDAIKDPDGHRSRRKSAFGDADENIVQFGQLWELDSTKGDVLLADGKRYVVIGCMDVWSRNAKLLVVPTAKAVGIGAMFRKALLDPMWGVPRSIRIDNGSDYISNHMLDIYRDLEIEPWVCPPGQPQKKPFIERFFGTFARSLVEFLPGFIGHNVAERKAIESRQAHEARMARKRLELAEEASRKLVHVGGELQVRMTPEEFQRFCDNWLKMYHHKKHGALAGMTPFQKRASWSGELPRVPERALDVLLLEGEKRVVGKEGIRFDNHTYASEELDARWRGKMVRIKYDAADAGFLYVFHPEAENGFICKAICPEIVGVARAELAAKIQAADGKYYSDGKRRIRALAKQAGDGTPHDRILGMYEEIDSTLTLFRSPSFEHTTPMLEAAAAAVVDEPLPALPAPLTLDEQAAAEAVFSRSLPNEDLFDWERAIYLEEKQEATGELTPAERVELEHMQRMPGYEFVIDYMGGAQNDRRAM